MFLRSIAFALLGTALLAGGAAAQQQPAAPNPLDAVPDAMPFNTPYGAPITLEKARAAIEAAVKEAAKRNWALNVAIVDSGGNLVAFERMDNAQLASISISEHKARTAVKYRRPTRAFEEGVQGKDLKYLMTLDDVIASRGGIPLVEGGKIVGAIGCSGGTGSQDEVACKVGADAVK
jgi:uncharacterized protein GlcG (DUF336 family)